MLVLSCLLGFYLTCVFSFCFVSHPVLMCLVLLVGSCCSCGLLYLFSGLSWYIVLFCLVYVGGVFVLFVYVSLYSPNSFFDFGVDFLLYFFFFFFGVFSFFWSLVGFVCVSESGHYLCSSGDGFGYCLFCLVLLLGFSLISFVSSRKDCFFR
uniref:NADH dehydrogenase subunit 6 n=1 Tax=Prosthogonimus cuneatus TaxID=232414 RepID=A0A7L7S1H1_9TREM|nr:NADH dehydrogenase subunit 6 [Prosthogonimus cuneatus]QNU39798.1 NADH dehydrogenase subunit 6 [Prosthogonimus cuneatus]